MRKTYNYKLYRNRRNANLMRQINIAGIIYNHCIALHRRYYRMHGKHLNQYQLMKHIARCKYHQNRLYWRQVPSQAIQDIVQRIEKGYQRFFDALKSNRRASPPGFRKVKRYRSITLKQAGWKRLEGNRIRIGKRIFKYCNSRPLPEIIKTLTIKRDRCGDLWLCFSCEVEIKPTLTATGKMAGCDFGLKRFITLSDQQGHIDSPQFLKINANKLEKANRDLSRKVKGSNNFHKARLKLAKAHRRISDQRNDWQWKTAQALVTQFDRLYFEDLNLDGMKRLWGRKISDLALDSFLKKIVYLAECESKHVGFVDRFYPSSKTCCICQKIYEQLSLSERRWQCQSCGSCHDRDENAANNIRYMGERACSPE